MSPLQWHSTADGSLPVNEDVVFIRHGFKYIETGYVTEEGIIPADIADDAADPCIPLECVEWFAPLEDALPENDEDVIASVIDRMFPPEREKALLEEIAREVEKTNEFRKLVEAHRKFPALTQPESRISLWIHGIDRQYYSRPHAIRHDVENIFTEFIVPVNEEYASIVSRVDIDELDALLLVSTAEDEDSDIDISAYPELERLIQELEDIGQAKALECSRLVGDRN